MSKKIEKKKFEFSKVGSILDNIAKTIPIQIEKEVTEKEFISTGVYILDAALSGRLIGGGIQSNKLSCFAGESGVGKSYLLYSLAKNAQKAGYHVIFIDTEQSVSLESFPQYGVDNSLNKFRLIKSGIVEDTSMTLMTLIDELKKAKLSGEQLPKIIIMLDSVGMMASNKERNDLLDQNIKQDMTKAKALASMFRSINNDLGYLGIPMIVSNHTYLTMDLFPSEKLRGGNGLLYTASVIGFMSKSKLKTGEEDDMNTGQSGISVLFGTSKNRLAKPKKIRFNISFTHGMNPYTGLDAFSSPEYFEQIGIAQGKMDVDKETGEMKFTPGGNRWYISHLNKSITTKQLFSPEVFTMDILKKMEPIVNDYFRYKSLDEIEKVESDFNKIIESNDEEDAYINADDINADDLFN